MSHLGLRCGLSSVERSVSVEEAMKRARLSALANRLPGELSRGQQQRVALARAPVINPKLFLLDEPLSNLDAKLRAEVRLKMCALQQRLGLTTLLVTHDPRGGADHGRSSRRHRVGQIGLAEGAV